MERHYNDKFGEIYRLENSEIERLTTRTLLSSYVSPIRIEVKHIISRATGRRYRIFHWLPVFRYY